MNPVELAISNLPQDVQAPKEKQVSAFSASYFWRHEGRSLTLRMYQGWCSYVFHHANEGQSAQGQYIPGERVALLDWLLTTYFRRGV